MKIAQLVHRLRVPSAKPDATVEHFGWQFISHRCECTFDALHGLV